MLKTLFQRNGLLEQWGVTGFANDGGLWTTFPVAYSKTPFVSVTPIENALLFRLPGLTKTSFMVVSAGDDRFRWFAKGF